MKKSVIFLLSFILSILFINLVFAENVPGLPSQLGQDPTELIEGVKNKTETGENYLKKEWKTILSENKVIGPVYNFIMVVLSPVSKLLLDREIDFTWIYFFSLFIWCAIVYVSFTPMREAFDLNWIIAIVAGILIASLCVRIIPDSIIEFQLSLIWKLIVVLIIMAFLVFVGIGSKKLGKIKEKDKKITRERKAAIVEKIHNVQIKSAGAD